MGLTDLSKLEKLTILAFDKVARPGPGKPLEVMFNPSTYSLQYKNVFQKGQGVNTTGRPARFVFSRPKNLRLEFLVDGTGVDQIGLLNLFGVPPTVDERVDEFLKHCFHTDGNIHQPKHLRLSWGKGELAKFDCRVESVDIEFTMFDQDGSPLAAKLSTQFVEDVDPARQSRENSFTSPDLTHSRVVKAGDTLPLLCQEIYGDARHYRTVARANGLDGFRRLQPGAVLKFPPLESTGGTGRGAKRK